LALQGAGKFEKFCRTSGSHACSLTWSIQRTGSSSPTAGSCISLMVRVSQHPYLSDCMLERAMTVSEASSAKHSRPSDYSDQWAHVRSSYLIIATSDYIVYMDEDGDLEWQTTSQYDMEITKRQGYSLAHQNAILNEAALLEATPCDGQEDRVTQQFKRLIGESLRCCLDVDYTGARTTLAAARQYIRARSAELSRGWYLDASFRSALPLAFGALGIWCSREWVASVVGERTLWMFLAVAAGGVGALLSVITRTGNLTFDSSAGRRLHFVEAVSRITAGAISGIVVSLAVTSELLFAPLTRNGQLHVVMILSALAAGAGERLAPSIISQFDSAQPNVRSDASASHDKDEDE